MQMGNRLRWILFPNAFYHRDQRHRYREQMIEFPFFRSIIKGYPAYFAGRVIVPTYFISFIISKFRNGRNHKQYICHCYEYDDSL